jgi:ketosteroid isomerase-like protein
MSTEKEILALEDKRYAAMTTNDLDALAAMFHDDLVYTHSSSVVDTKPSYLEALRSGKTRYKSAKRFEEKVRFVGDTALVTGRAEMEAEINGNPRSLRLRFLNVWSKTPAGWKFIAWHSCSMPA